MLCLAGAVPDAAYHDQMNMLSTLKVRPQCSWPFRRVALTCILCAQRLMERLEAAYGKKRFVAFGKSRLPVGPGTGCVRRVCSVGLQRVQCCRCFVLIVSCSLLVRCVGVCVGVCVSLCGVPGGSGGHTAAVLPAEIEVRPAGHDGGAGAGPIHAKGRPRVLLAAVRGDRGRRPGRLRGGCAGPAFGGDPGLHGRVPCAPSPTLLAAWRGAEDFRVVLQAALSQAFVKRDARKTGYLRVMDIKGAFEDMDPMISRQRMSYYLKLGTQHRLKELSWDSLIDYEQFAMNLQNTLIKWEHNWDESAGPIVTPVGWIDDGNDDGAGDSDSGSDGGEGGDEDVREYKDGDEAAGVGGAADPGVAAANTTDDAGRVVVSGSVQPPTPRADAAADPFPPTVQTTSPRRRGGRRSMSKKTSKRAGKGGAGASPRRRSQARKTGMRKAGGTTRSPRRVARA